MCIANSMFVHPPCLKIYLCYLTKQNIVGFLVKMTIGKTQHISNISEMQQWTNFIPDLVWAHTKPCFFHHKLYKTYLSILYSYFIILKVCSFLFISWKGKASGGHVMACDNDLNFINMTDMFIRTPYSLKWIMGYAQLSQTVRLTA